MINREELDRLVLELVTYMEKDSLEVMTAGMMLAGRIVEQEQASGASSDRGFKEKVLKGTGILSIFHRMLCTKQGI